MNEEQYKALVEKVGKEAADKIKSEMANYEAKAKEIALEAVKQGGITKERFQEYEDATKTTLEEMKKIAEKQGTTLTEVAMKLNAGPASAKSIAEVLKENEDEIRKVFSNGSGTKTFMVQQKADGTWGARPFDMTNPNADKAAGTTGTVGGLSGVGSTASISQSIDAASLLRMGGMAQIVGQFRNTQWLFDLVNVTQASFGEMPLAIWFEEVPKQGAPAQVAEGAPKPLVQYAYTLKSATYKKVAALINFTEEFSLDFPRLQSDILGKGRIDVLNQLNTALLTNIMNTAVAYNTATQFEGGEPLTNVNDWDAIAAMAAQADNATYGNALANTAITSTFKKYRMGVTKTTDGAYVDRPKVLDNLTFVGNPEMQPDNALVGDLTKVNLILRGGFLVKIGYNGTDFAENKFSVVLEQFYMDYIAAINAPALVKGPTLTAVKTAIAA